MKKYYHLGTAYFVGFIVSFVIVGMTQDQAFITVGSVFGLLLLGEAAISKDRDKRNAPAIAGGAWKPNRDSTTTPPRMDENEIASDHVDRLYEKSMSDLSISKMCTPGKPIEEVILNSEESVKREGK